MCNFCKLSTNRSDIIKKYTIYMCTNSRFKALQKSFSSFTDQKCIWSNVFHVFVCKMYKLCAFVCGCVSVCERAGARAYASARVCKNKVTGYNENINIENELIVRGIYRCIMFGLVDIFLSAYHVTLLFYL